MKTTDFAKHLTVFFLSIWPKNEMQAPYNTILQGYLCPASIFYEEKEELGGSICEIVFIDKSNYHGVSAMDTGRM